MRALRMLRRRKLSRGYEFCEARDSARRRARCVFFGSVLAWTAAKSTTRGNCAAKGASATRRGFLSELKLRPPENLWHPERREQIPVCRHSAAARDERSLRWCERVSCAGLTGSAEVDL